MEPSTATDNFKNAVFYGIYPKSFFDSDGDGVGDLKGILSKLPYLVSLGADVIVLSSLFETTSEDLFFAPTDLCRVNPAIGTMDDFEELVSKAHESGLKVFLSFPLSATSVSHPWFEKSKESVSLNPYREYYTWQVGRKKSPPDNKKTRFKTPLWSFDAKTNEWYRSFYGENYPELNYDNPRVRKDISDVFRFWKEKGVDGFFVENAYFSARKPLWGAQKPPYKLSEDFFEEGKDLYRILLALKEKFANEFPVFIQADAVEPGLYPYLLESEKPVADGLLSECLLSATRIACPTSFSLKDFVKTYLSLQKSPSAERLSVCFEDKDHTRLISKILSLSDENYLPAAKLLAAMLLFSVSAPVLYQGEEIGMTDFTFTKSDLRNKGQVDPLLFHSRSAFQWDNVPHGAFTAAAFSAFPVNENYHKINLLAQSADPKSVFTFYRRMIAFRKGSSAVKSGNFKDFSYGNFVCFLREDQTERLLFIANPTHKHVNVRTPSEFSNESALCEICNYDVVSKTLNQTMGLRPYEVRVFRLKAPLLALN